MFSPRFSVLLATLLHATQLIQVSMATHIDLIPRSGPLHKRSSTSGLVFGSLGYYQAYYINITLGGIPFSVLIDTGSADLWVASTVPHANTTGVNSTIPYVSGSDSGTIKTAELEILGFTVPSQAFIEVSPGDSTPNGIGLIGFGPNSQSNIYTALQSTSIGDVPLDNIFRQNLTTPNFVTFLLNRPNAANTYPGAMTISEVLPQYSNISNQPKVPVSVLSKANSGDQGWLALLDKNGVIGPDGKVIPLTSNATGAPTHDATQMVTSFDTGLALPQVPSAVASAMYSGAKGARLHNSTLYGGDIWVIDCDAEVNVTFSIGGQLYPVHPLDTNWVGADDNGKPICIGTFQPMTPSAFDPTRDMILGMQFLTNVYLLLDYGDFIDTTTNNTANPYVQLISTIDPTTAHKEFVAMRLNGTNPLGTNQTSGSHRANGSVGMAKGFVETYKTLFIAGVAGAVVLLS